MGTFTQPLTLVGSTGERRTVDALVETGSTFTCVPSDILTGLGVEPRRRVLLKLADGSSHEQQLGRCVVQLDGLEEMTFVVFGEPGSPPIIGAITLESLLLGIDPVSQRLVPVEGWQA